jgi:hypothetical protein
VGAPPAYNRGPYPGPYGGYRGPVVRGNTRIDYHPGGGRTLYRGGVPYYTQNHVFINNRPVLQRTYYRGGGVPVVHTYNPYRWGHRVYFGYAPARWYGPQFYRYFHTPWGRPVTYRWGWYGAPWYGYYGYYYRPYPVYYSPAYWLTDWLLAGLLADEYANAVAVAQGQAYADAQAQADANAQAQAAANAQAAAEFQAQANFNAQQAQAYPPPPPPDSAAAVGGISDEVKDQIKQQVEESIQAHEARTPVEVGSLLSDTKHIYAVSEDINATAGDGTPCSLTSGDLIRLSAPPAQGDEAASMLVVSSKRGSCPAGAVVMVSITDLQSFQNDFSERVEEGMEKMQSEFSQPQQPQPQQPQPQQPQLQPQPQPLPQP